jgi:glycosyltransferase involved in cell wall biosynthesis
MDNKPKVAIIYHYIAHYRYPIFQELMTSKDIDFTIFSGEASEINIKKVDKNIAHIPVSDGGLRWEFFKNNWFKNIILWQTGLVNMVRKGNHDGYIFLGNPYHISTWLAAGIARLKGKRVYYWMHGVYTEKPALIDYIKMYVFYKIPHGFFLYGNRAASVLEKRRVKKQEHIHVIYNSLDYKLSKSIRKPFQHAAILSFREKYFNAPDVPVVVCIGRLIKEKKIDYLLAAQKILKEKYNTPFFNVLLIGSGAEMEHLKNIAAQNGLSAHVYFYGDSYDEQVNGHLLGNSDLCITPGEIGLTAIHALSYGTPVISHNELNIQAPEAESIIVKETGDLFEYENIEDLAKVIEEWLLKHPIKNEDLVNKCYKVVDDFYNPGYQAKVINKVFSDLKG